MLDIERIRPEISNLCRDLEVKRLDIFGSATSDDFRPESDVDVLVQFERDNGRLFDRYFELKERLEEILGRTVDVVVEDAITNPYFKLEVERSRKNVYTARGEETPIRYS
jgi:predicted nucleotidyltransferase